MCAYFICYSFYFQSVFICYYFSLNLFLFYLQGGFTGLYLAAQEGYKDIVALLLIAGASGKLISNVRFCLFCQHLAIEAFSTVWHLGTIQLLQHFFGISKLLSAVI